MPSISASSVIQPVVFVLDTMFKAFNLDNVPEDDKARITALQKKEAVDEILSLQLSLHLKLDGYVLYQDNVYQVYASSKQSKKIFGPEVKPMKKRLQALLPK